MSSLGSEEDSEGVGPGPGLGVSWGELLCAKGDQGLGGRAGPRFGELRTPAPCLPVVCPL